jgi:branched-chain amino acid transport system substrate-binding protein
MRSPLAFAAALCSLVLATAARADEVVRIGWLSSLTGPLSSAAIAENQGVRYAVDEINKSGGILGHQVELLTRDTAGDPVKAVNLANQLAFSDNVKFVIGPVNSGESLATVPALNKAGVLNIVIGSLEQLIDPAKYPLAFRTINTNTQWISTANHYAIDTLKRGKVAIVGDTSGYGTASAKTVESLLKQMGVTPVYSVLVDANKTDLSDELSKAKAAGADVIMPWTAATGLCARIINTRGDMGWDAPIVGHPAVMALPIKALLNKPDYWKNVYAAGYVSTTFQDGKLPARTQALVDVIKPALGGRIDFTFWWVALGYDSMKVIAYGAEQAKSLDPDKIKAVLEHTADYPGVYGAYSWTPAQHNGFPDAGMMMNAANTFQDGSYQPAPR